MGLKVKLMDIMKRLTPFDKKLGIILNGEDNAYPERMERFINNSVTTKTAANIMAAYLVGLGFDEETNKIIVHKDNNTTLLKFLRKVGKTTSKQRGVFVHVNYNLNYTFDSFDMLPYSHCRLGKKDDTNYNGKIGVNSNFSSVTKNSEIEFIDVFNPDEEVIKAQAGIENGDSEAEKAIKMKAYKGQILYYSFDDEYDYALSTIDAVYNDCDSEAQASIYKNKSLRKGFFGKTLVLTNPLIGNLEDYNSPEDYAIAKSERDEFKETIDSFIGAENAGGVLHVEKEKDDSEALEDVFKVINIDSNIDDKMFEYTETSVFKNILMAFNNIPNGLVRSDNTLFANSGESLAEMQRIYQNNTMIERIELQQLVNLLMKNFKEPKENLEIIPLIDVDELKKEENGTDVSNNKN